MPLGRRRANNAGEGNVISGHETGVFITGANAAGNSVLGLSAPTR
jgi:hypothetical protein